MKLLHERYKNEPALLQRFVEEAQIGGQLQHPGIVPVYDLGMHEDRPFFTMKLVKGKTLAALLADRQDYRQQLGAEGHGPAAGSFRQDRGGPGLQPAHHDLLTRLTGLAGY